MSHKPKATFDLRMPDVTTIPLVVDSPHSGTQLPEDFHFTCSLGDLRQSEDTYVDRFAHTVPKNGGIFLRSLISRAYIDLNRAIGDLHPSLCSETIPWPLSKSKRVNYGMGLIRHLVRPNEPVYAEPLSLGAIQHRIIHYYEPYYAALEKALRETHRDFGRVLHLNLHAMPRLGVDGSPQPDIVLGDHDGHSCGRPYREVVKKTFEAHGFKVVINHPYKGVELTRRFAKPRQGFHSLQIEVNKALYMDEATFALNDGVPALQAAFDDLWKSLSAMLQASQQNALPKAAE